LTIELAHAADLRVHAWVNVNLVASGTTLPRSEEHVALRHPSWLMLPKPLAASLRAIDPESPAYIGALSRWTRAASEQVEGLYLSPLVPEARAHTTAVVRELATRYAPRRYSPRLHPFFRRQSSTTAARALPRFAPIRRAFSRSTSAAASTQTP
jgi:hypothetical protein